MKRFHARGRGRSAGIEKFFSQITIVVEEKREPKEETKKAAAKKAAEKKPAPKRAKKSADAAQENA